MSDSKGDIAGARADMLEQWAAFCDRMKAVGERIMQKDFPQDDQATAEGVRHLSRMVALGLTMHFDYDDPEFPRWLAHNDDIAQWGGNNADNAYFYARIDARASYRVYGNVGNTSGFILSVRDGFMHQGREGVTDLSSEAMEISEQGDFELIISEEKPGDFDGNWMKMLPNGDQLGLRIYYDDWGNQTPPAIHVVRVGNEGGGPEPLQPPAVLHALKNAGDWIETNLPYWNEWLSFRQQFLPINGISPPMEVPGGSNSVITYAGGRFQLEAGQALVLTLKPLDAEYIGLVYYTEAWFETGDFANRTASLNQNQLHVDSDGCRRIVVCGDDPGVQNWLDTEGRATGLLVMRTVNGNAMPEVTPHVLPTGSLRELLPNDTQWMTPSQRVAQIMIRREHIASRFHR